MTEGTASPTLAELIRQYVEDRLFQVHTAQPGRIVDYDEDTQSATVQPILKRAFLVDGEEIIKTPPPIQNVPVLMLYGGGYVVKFPLAAGDIVLLLCSERSIDKWLDADPSDNIDPIDTRKHDLSDAIAIPGLVQRRHTSEASAGDSLLLASEDGKTRVKIDKGGEVEIEASSIKIGEGAAEPAVLGTALATYLNTTMRIPSPIGPLGPATPNIGTVTGELSEKVEVE